MYYYQIWKIPIRICSTFGKKATFPCICIYVAMSNTFLRFFLCFQLLLKLDAVFQNGCRNPGPQLMELYYGNLAKVLSEIQPGWTWQLPLLQTILAAFPRMLITKRAPSGVIKSSKRMVNIKSSFTKLKDGKLLYSIGTAHGALISCRLILSLAHI